MNNIYEDILNYCLDNDLFNNNAKVMMEALLDTQINVDNFNYKSYKYGDKKLLLININK